MKIISRRFEGKANCCNNETSRLYAFKGQNPKKIGMCADCFVDWLIVRKADIKIKGEL